MTDNKAVMQHALREIEAYWWKVDGEWGPAEGGLERAILRGEEPVVSALRAAIAQPAPDADDDAMRSPAYNFDSVNKFVHESDAQYEELQSLCLGLVSKLERNQAVRPEQTRPTITAYLTRHDTGDMLFFDKAEAQLGWTPDGTFIDEGTKAAIAQPKQPAPVRQPLTGEAIDILWTKLMCGQGSGDITDFVRDIEAAHGIAQPKDKP